MKKIKYYFLLFFKQEQGIYLLLSFAFFLSLVAGYYFIFIQRINFSYIDANTRINIARRIFDSLTPGFGQVGAIWPPFPQVAMIPFVASDYLWRTGIAGWIVSGSTYIISSLTLYKIAKRLTGSIVISFLSASIFLLNINVLYLQSTAMSESFFLMSLILIFYFMLIFIQTEKTRFLIYSAGFVSIATLTRFESYSILFASVVIVFLFLLLKKYKKGKIESTLILYIMPAIFGITIWTIYLWTIFGDPFYWLHYYASVGVEPTVHQVVHIVRPSYFQAAMTYITAVTNINGLVTAIFGGVSFLVVLLHPKIESKYKILLIFPLMLFLFMILSISRNTVIKQPAITLYSLQHKPNSIVDEFNIRYGMLMLPYLIIFTALLLKKIKFIIIPVSLLFLFQVIAYFATPYNLTYQLRSNLTYKQSAYVSWFKQNYHGGLIMESAGVHDNEMNQMGVPYKRFIYEGTQHYWKESLINPGKYATWIIFSKENDTDPVALAFRKQNMNALGFTLKYTEGDLLVYKNLNN